MKDRTKEIIKDGFGSLVNNASAIRGAKNGPLWLTIVMFVLTIVTALVPNFITQTTRTGSSFLNSYSYNLEQYVTSIALDLSTKNNAEFIISEEHELSIKENGAEIDFSQYGATKPYAAYINSATQKYDFLVYLSDYTAANDKESFIANSLEKDGYYVKVETTNEETNTTTVTNSRASADTDNAYHPSFLVLFKNDLYLCIYSSYTNQAITSSATTNTARIGRDFNTIEPTETLLTDLLTVKDSEDKEVTKSLSNSLYVSGVYSNFKKLLNKSYESMKVRVVWATTGMYAAVFFGLTLIMGFVVWLLTRGKNNPNNYFSVWLCYKIQARIGLAPAILSLLIGFFYSQSVIIFIALIGLRVMWMSMKELRPIPQA